MRLYQGEQREREGGGGEREREKLTDNCYLDNHKMGWVGGGVYNFLACESLHVRAVCIWRCVGRIVWRERGREREEREGGEMGEVRERGGGGEREIIDSCCYLDNRKMEG